MVKKAPCEKCGRPGIVYAITEGYVSPSVKHLAGPIALCLQHLRTRQQEIFWHAHPKGYDFAKAETEELAAEIVARGEGAPRKGAPAAPAEAKLVAAAIQRLVEEARRLEDPHPHPLSMNWIGRDLEVEGWDRKTLRSALALALADGGLVIEHKRDRNDNRKKVIRPAPTGVATEIFA